MRTNLEGFSKSVKQVVNASKSGRLHGVFGPVSRVISVPKKYAVAIEIALGAAMQNIVVGSDEDAKQAIRYLKSTDGGRATFLPLNTIKPRELKESGLDDCYGFVGVAADLCSCDDKFHNILGSLLGKIVIAEDLNSAASIAKKYSYRFKVVTLDGQVVNAGGSLTGGSLARSTGVLSRASEIEQLKAQTDKLTAKQSEAEAAAWNSLTANIPLLKPRCSAAAPSFQTTAGSCQACRRENRACENELQSQNESMSSARG